MRKQLMMALSMSLLTSCAATEGLADGDRELSRRVLIAGDSTAADYPPLRAPQIGWGQVVDYYLSDDVTVLNRAVNGRSTKSYIDEGKWASLLGEVGAGDLVLISFGHNDSRDDAPERYAAADGAYRENMARFAGDVKAKGGVPVILSSPARRLWEGPAMVETHGLYRVNAELAAMGADAEYIDLAQFSMDYFETLGRAETKKDFLWLSADELAKQLPAYVERYPDGLEDNTHFTEIGACGVARIVARHLDQMFPQLVEEGRFDERISDEAGRPADIVKCAARAWEEKGTPVEEPKLSGRIFLTGDSTASDYQPDYAPRTGWGQVLGYYLNDDSEAINLAADGRSTKTYIEEGRWDALIEQVGEGDLVLLTFGHNDAFKISERRYAAADGAFRQNMTDFANQVQAKGGIPVILSPVARRNWSDGQMVDSFPAYRLNAELAADQAGARFMDFTGLSMAYFEALGVESTKTDFMWLSLEEMSDLHPVYLQRNDENLEDNTHFKEIGACGVAWVVAQNLPNVLPETGRLFTPESQRKSDQADERPDAVRACAGEAQKRNAN